MLQSIYTCHVSPTMHMQTVYISDIRVFSVQIICSHQNVIATLATLFFCRADFLQSGNIAEGNHVD